MSRGVPMAAQNGNRGPRPSAPGVVTLDHLDATNVSLCGGKASALAVARRAGLPVRPGFVLTADGVARRDSEDIQRQLANAWRDLTDGGTADVIVRSSST